MRRSLKYCFVGFVVSLILAYVLLAAVAFLPQSMIEKHIEKDIAQLHEEGMYSPIGDWMGNSLLPMSTELIMLTESVNLNKNDLSAVLTNPCFINSGEDDYIDALEKYLNGEDDVQVMNYVHYWMGYRVIIRTLLTVFGYYEIRRFTALMFFTLLALVAWSLNRNLNDRIAMAFVFSVILVKPQIVSLSPHYSCCFIIAFIAMLMMPYLLRKRCIPRTLIFLELGIITMFFDFYTTPIITFGFPFLYLYLLEQREGTYIGIRELLGMLIAWVAGYLLMWLSKLILTSIFTDINSFANALEAVKIWLVIGRGNVDSSGGNMLSYLMGVAYGFYQYTKWLALLLVFFAVFAAVYVYWVKKNRVSLGWLKKNKMLLIIAAVPLVWFVITSKPSFFHNGYQYRNIALFFFALGSYLAGAVKDKKAT